VVHGGGETKEGWMAEWYTEEGWTVERDE